MSRPIERPSRTPRLTKKGRGWLEKIPAGSMSTRPPRMSGAGRSNSTVGGANTADSARPPAIAVRVTRSVRPVTPEPARARASPSAVKTSPCSIATKGWKTPFQKSPVPGITECACASAEGRSTDHKRRHSADATLRVSRSALCDEEVNTTEHDQDASTSGNPAIEGRSDQQAKSDADQMD